MARQSLASIRGRGRNWPTITRAPRLKRTRTTDGTLVRTIASARTEPVIVARQEPLARGQNANPAARKTPLRGPSGDLGGALLGHAPVPQCFVLPLVLDVG